MSSENAKKKGGGRKKGQREPPFGCVPNMWIARDIVHRAVIEMVLPGEKRWMRGERKNGWVLGRSGISSDGVIRETGWYYRNYGRVSGRIRRDEHARRVVETVRIWFMRGSLVHGTLEVLSPGEVQRAVAGMDWSMVLGVLAWCGAIYAGKWKTWRLPAWFLYAVWDRKVQKRERWDFLTRVLSHIYVQFDMEPEVTACWDIEHQHAGDGVGDLLFGRWDELRQKQVRVPPRYGHGYIPWCIMRMSGREEAVGRLATYIQLNDNPKRSHRVDALVLGTYGDQTYQQICQDRWKLRRIVNTYIKGERVLENYGWECAGGFQKLVDQYGYGYKLLDRSVMYRRREMGKGVERREAQRQWYGTNIYQRVRV